MFRIFGVLTLLMISLVVGAAELPSPASMAQKENSIVAIVNDSVILQSELDLQLKQAALQAQAAQKAAPASVDFTGEKIKFPDSQNLNHLCFHPHFDQHSLELQ